MNYTMTFPDTWEEYERLYGFTDDAELYTNGCRLIQSFRVEQWLQHISEHTNVPERKVGKWEKIDLANYKALCSQCGTWSPVMGRFCPYCGAQMRRSEE